MIQLKKAMIEDCEAIHQVQIQAFQALFEKYQDEETNPGAEKIDFLKERFQQDNVDIYTIQLEQRVIGAIIICRYGNTIELNRICILPKYQRNGYAKEAIRMVEGMYHNAEKWVLETVLQEEGLCNFYEQMGYEKTDRLEHVQEGLDIIYYEK